METIKINIDDIKTPDFIKISQGVKLINEGLSTLDGGMKTTTINSIIKALEYENKGKNIRE